MCRKVVETSNGGVIEMWSNGRQKLSFLNVNECLESAIRLMRPGLFGPVNIGSDQMFTIHSLAEMAGFFVGKSFQINNNREALGAMGRSPDIRLILAERGWQQSQSLRKRMEEICSWIIIVEEAEKHSD